jgi:hypothetical protein
MTCATCHPPSTDRLGEGHVAVRFGDAARGWLILLAGVDVTNDCTEAHGGDPGWAVLLRWGPRSSQAVIWHAHLYGHPPTFIRHGTVQVVRGAPRRRPAEATL